MTFSDDLMVCADVEGLLCLSDLPDLSVQPLCSVEQPCLNFFPGMGFRSAAWTMQRDQYGDHEILVVSGDDVYLAKYDAGLNAFAFLPDMPLPFLPEGSASAVVPLLAIPTPGTVSNYGGPPGFPGYFGGGGGVGGSKRPVPNDSGGSPSPTSPARPSKPGKPEDGTHTGGGGDPDLPPLTPVPLSGSGLFLVLALAAMMLKVGCRKLSAVQP